MGPPAGPLHVQPRDEVVVRGQGHLGARPLSPAALPHGPAEDLPRARYWGVVRLITPDPILKYAWQTPRVQTKSESLLLTPHLPRYDCKRLVLVTASAEEVATVVDRDKASSPLQGWSAQAGPVPCRKRELAQISTEHAQGPDDTAMYKDCAAALWHSQGYSLPGKTTAPLLGSVMRSARLPFCCCCCCCCCC